MVTHAAFMSCVRVCEGEEGGRGEGTLKSLHKVRGLVGRG